MNFLGFIVLEVLRQIHDLNSRIVNRVLILLNLPTVDHYEKIIKMKFVSIMFIFVKHLLTNLLFWFPLDFEDQKSLMLYLILPVNTGFFRSFLSILNPPKLDTDSMGDPLNFLSISKSMPTSAGHAAINLASETWAKTLNESRMKWDLEEQKKLLASLTQPLRQSNENSSIISRSSSSDRILYEEPIGLDQ